MLIKGPFDLKWGDSTLLDVEAIEIDHEIQADEYVSNKGLSYELERSHKIAVTLTLLASDVASLALVLPQNHVAVGNNLTSGETVSDTAGAIQFIGEDCDEEMIYNNLEIIPCGGQNPQITRVLNARTRLDGIENDGKVQKVRVKFLGEAPIGTAAIQMFKEGLVEEEILLLGDNDPFLLGDGSNLTLF